MECCSTEFSLICLPSLELAKFINDRFKLLEYKLLSSFPPFGETSCLAYISSASIFLSLSINSIFLLVISLSLKVFLYSSYLLFAINSLVFLIDFNWLLLLWLLVLTRNLSCSFYLMAVMSAYFYILSFLSLLNLFKSIPIFSYPLLFFDLLISFLLIRGLSWILMATIPCYKSFHASPIFPLTFFPQLLSTSRSVVMHFY